LFIQITACAKAPTIEALRTELPTASQIPTTTSLSTLESPTMTPAPTDLGVVISSSLLPTLTPPAVSYHDVVVHRLDPFTNGNRRIFGPGFWNSEYKFTFTYSTEDSSAIWGSYNIATNTETLALAPVTYNNNFWPSKDLWQIPEQQEVVGYFSTSGTYILYTLWHTASDNPPSRTEVWLANTLDDTLLKLQTFSSLNLSIAHAIWSKDESKLYFSVTYEGPDEIFVTDVGSGETIPLSAITDFDGVSEEIWSLSPDEQQMAVIDLSQSLVIVHLDGNNTQTIDSGNALLPSWSADGQSLYYWWGNSPNDSRQMSELRKYNQGTGKISTLVNDVSLREGFARISESEQSNSVFQTGTPYVVSPEEKKLLVWGESLFWVVLDQE
jgi:hypothetical protein